MARNAGLTSKEIDALASDGPVTGIDHEYVLLCRDTDELPRGGTLTDDTLTQLLDTYGDVLTRKYVTTIAWFNLLSLLLNGCRVPLETTDKIGSDFAPLSKTRCFTTSSASVLAMLEERRAAPGGCCRYRQRYDHVS